MANYTNTPYDNISNKRSIPYSASNTGTIGTQGIAVEGVSTLFLTEMLAGAVIVDLTNWEWRKVVRVDSNTLAYIEKPFTADLANGTTPNVIPHTTSRAKGIYISTPGAAFIDNKAFTGALALDKAANEKSGRRDFVDPIIVDATGTTMQVEIIY